MSFQGNVRSFDLFNDMVSKGYVFEWIADGECIIRKPDAGLYIVSITGETYEIGCTCPGGDFKDDRREKHPEKSEWQIACKHEKIVMDAHECPRCGSVSLYHEYMTPMAQENSFFACLKCKQVIDARNILIERRKKTLKTIAERDFF